jgi:hypothetical protein
MCTSPEFGRRHVAEGDPSKPPKLPKPRAVTLDLVTLTPTAPALA